MPGVICCGRRYPFAADEGGLMFVPRAVAYLIAWVFLRFVRWNSLIWYIKGWVYRIRLLGHVSSEKEESTIANRNIVDYCNTNAILERHWLEAIAGLHTYRIYEWTIITLIIFDLGLAILSSTISIREQLLSKVRLIFSAEQETNLARLSVEREVGFYGGEVLSRSPTSTMSQSSDIARENLRIIPRTCLIVYAPFGYLEKNYQEPCSEQPLLQPGIEIHSARTISPRASAAENLNEIETNNIVVNDSQPHDAIQRKKPKTFASPAQESGQDGMDASKPDLKADVDKAYVDPHILLNPDGGTSGICGCVTNKALNFYPPTVDIFSKPRGMKKIRLVECLLVFRVLVVEVLFVIIILFGYPFGLLEPAVWVGGERWQKLEYILVERLQYRTEIDKAMGAWFSEGAFQTDEDYYEAAETLNEDYNRKRFNLAAPGAESGQVEAPAAETPGRKSSPMESGFSTVEAWLTETSFMDGWKTVGDQVLNIGNAIPQSKEVSSEPSMSTKARFLEAKEKQPAIFMDVIANDTPEAGDGMKDTAAKTVLSSDSFLERISRKNREDSLSNREDQLPAERDRPPSGGDSASFPESSPRVAFLDLTRADPVSPIDPDLKQFSPTVAANRNLGERVWLFMRAAPINRIGIILELIVYVIFIFCMHRRSQVVKVRRAQYDFFQSELSDTESDTDVETHTTSIPTSEIDQNRKLSRGKKQKKQTRCNSACCNKRVRREQFTVLGSENLGGRHVSVNARDPNSFDDPNESKLTSCIQCCMCRSGREAVSAAVILQSIATDVPLTFFDLVLAFLITPARAAEDPIAVSSMKTILHNRKLTQIERVRAIGEHEGTRQGQHKYHNGNGGERGYSTTADDGDSGPVSLQTEGMPLISATSSDGGDSGYASMSGNNVGNVVGLISANPLIHAQGLHDAVSVDPANYVSLKNSTNSSKSDLRSLLASASSLRMVTQKNLSMESTSFRSNRRRKSLGSILETRIKSLVKPSTLRRKISINMVSSQLPLAGVEGSPVGHCDTPPFDTPRDVGDFDAVSGEDEAVSEVFSGDLRSDLKLLAPRDAEVVSFIDSFAKYADLMYGPQFVGFHMTAFPKVGIDRFCAMACLKSCCCCLFANGFQRPVQRDDFRQNVARFFTMVKATMEVRTEKTSDKRYPWVVWVGQRLLPKVWYDYFESRIMENRVANGGTNPSANSLGGSTFDRRGATPFLVGPPMKAVDPYVELQATANRIIIMNGNEMINGTGMAIENEIDGNGIAGNLDVDQQLALQNNARDPNSGEVLRGLDILYVSYKNNQSPPFGVFLDHEQRTFVISIRGTNSQKDVFQDLAADLRQLYSTHWLNYEDPPEHWLNHEGTTLDPQEKIHGGILHAARRILKKIEALNLLHGVDLENGYFDVDRYYEQPKEIGEQAREILAKRATAGNNVVNMRQQPEVPSEYASVHGRHAARSDEAQRGEEVVTEDGAELDTSDSGETWGPRYGLVYKKLGYGGMCFGKRKVAGEEWRKMHSRFDFTSCFSCVCSHYTRLFGKPRDQKGSASENSLELGNKTKQVEPTVVDKVKSISNDGTMVNENGMMVNATFTSSNGATPGVQDAPPNVQTTIVVDAGTANKGTLHDGTLAKTGSLFSKEPSATDLSSNQSISTQKPPSPATNSEITRKKYEGNGFLPPTSSNQHYRIVVTGHSLGSAIASVIALLLRRRYGMRDLKALACGSVGACFTPKLCKELEPCLISVVVDQDWVGTVSVPSVLRAQDRMMRHMLNHRQSKCRLICTYCLPVCCGCALSHERQAKTRARLNRELLVGAHSWGADFAGESNAIEENVPYVGWFHSEGATEERKHDSEVAAEKCKSGAGRGASSAVTLQQIRINRQHSESSESKIRASLHERIAAANQGVGVGRPKTILKSNLGAERKRDSTHPGQLIQQDGNTTPPSKKDSLNVSKGLTQLGEIICYDPDMVNLSAVPERLKRRCTIAGRVLHFRPDSTGKRNVGKGGEPSQAVEVSVRKNESKTGANGDNLVPDLKFDCTNIRGYFERYDPPYRASWVATPELFYREMSLNLNGLFNHDSGHIRIVFFNVFDRFTRKLEEYMKRKREEYVKQKRGEKEVFLKITQELKKDGDALAKRLSVRNAVANLVQRHSANKVSVMKRSNSSL